MGRQLSLEQIKSESENGDVDVDSTISLNLTHRPLTDVSCLAKFRNLERLDLSHNCLSTIQVLSGCIKLKWLKLVQNKLISLKGVECLTKLTVLNAGMNKIQKIDEVQSLSSLGALILNNNNISSICKLEQLKYLNTLVLSDNPIHDIGDALVNVKSILKLSLSRCQIEKIGTTLTSCIMLKEARFAYNKVVTLPDELAQNSNLQILDMGNNLIETWSDIKVLSELQNLKNFNLQGNPIAQKAKLAKKVKKLVPGLRILNSKRIEKNIKGEATGADKTTRGMDHDHTTETVEANILQTKKPKLDSNVVEEKELISSSNNSDAHPICNISRVDEESEQKASRPNVKKLETKRKRFADDATDLKGATKQKRNKAAVIEEGEVDGIDNAEAPFLDRLLKENSQHSQKDQKGLNVKHLEGLVVNHSKKKAKHAATGLSALQLMSSVDEVGMGGPSAWDD